ncbi:MAG: hypothetical protein ACRD3J_19255 [Thermoanaerobaculia bacterium]
MRYFFDRQTDAISFDLAEGSEYSGSEPLAPGVTLHVDSRRHPLMLEVQKASEILDVKGLVPQQALAIAPDEIARRMTATATGELIWRKVVQRTIVPALIARTVRDRNAHTQKN